MNHLNNDVEANETNNMAPAKRRFVPQWSLRTMLLLTAVVAAWIPYVRLRQEIAESERQISTMRGIARELVIEDPTQIAIVGLPQVWAQEDRWDVYLPEGDYKLLLATREVDAEGFPLAGWQASLSAGKHRIELRQSKMEGCPKITVAVDEHVLIEAIENPGWPLNSKNGYVTDSIANCLQIAPDGPVAVVRCIYSIETADGAFRPPDGPADGILLWIERVEEDH